MAHRTERSTADWQAADAAHFLHPFTDFKALSAKGNLAFASAAAVMMLAITAVVFLPLVLLTAWQQRNRKGAAG